MAAVKYGRPYPDLSLFHASGNHHIAVQTADIMQHNTARLHRRL